MPKTVTNYAEKYEGLIQSKINSELLKERIGRFSKHKSMVDLQQSLVICTLYKNLANFLKMIERFTKTE